MHDIAFSDWLEQIDGRPLPQLQDNVSRVRRVEKAMSIDIDSEYSSNRCERIIEILDFNNPAVQSNPDLPKGKAGLSSLKTAVRKYVHFRDWQMK